MYCGVVCTMGLYVLWIYVYFGVVCTMEPWGCMEQGEGGLAQGGNVCPAHARRATFVLSILSLAPSLSSPWEVPRVDCTRPQNFPAKHLA